MISERRKKFGLYYRTPALSRQTDSLGVAAVDAEFLIALYLYERCITKFFIFRNRLSA
jgi:hypothetical protein